MSIKDSVGEFVRIHVQSIEKGYESPTSEGINSEAERATSVLVKRLPSIFRRNMNSKETLELILAASVAEEKMLNAAGFSGIGVVNKKTNHCRS